MHVCAERRARVLSHGSNRAGHCEAVPELPNNTGRLSASQYYSHVYNPSQHGRIHMALNCVRVRVRVCVCVCVSECSACLCETSINPFNPVNASLSF